MLPSRSFVAGECIFQQGDDADCAYIIDAGEIDVVLDREGEREILARLGPGHLLGEMAILDAHPRSATALARRSGSLTILARDQLSSRLRETDPVVRLVLDVLLDRLRGQLTRPHHLPMVPPAVSLPTVAHTRAIERIKLESDLRAGLGDGQMRLFVQPIADCKTQTIRGFEALIRWEHPTRGMVAPDAFVKVAEESGLIVPLGRWIAHEACICAQRLESEANRAKVQGQAAFVSINVSGGQFRDPEFLHFLQESITTSGVNPRRLKLELTESILVDVPSTQRWMTQAKLLGVRIALDDFGTGYSSLSYLHELTFDTLKIDQSFVRQMLHDSRADTIVKAIVALADALGLETIAEGIESAAHLEHIAAFGCTYAQGYFIAKPMAIDALFHGGPEGGSDG